MQTWRHPAVSRALIWRRLHVCAAHASNPINEIPAVDRLLSGRQWLLNHPGAEITPVVTANGPAFKVLRDDLGHPYVGGNKRRKLDALFPELLAAGVTDIVTCGGLQSAHTLAVAAAAAEAGVRAHLLVRGERPVAPTGNHLFSRMFAHSVTYVPRSEYSDREKMLQSYVERLKERDGAAKVAAVPEGGAEAAALLGCLRLVDWLAGAGALLPAAREATVVVDSGTGASAAGLALGAALMQLPWTVTGVMLAGPLEYYEKQAVELVREFSKREGLSGSATEALVTAVAARLRWVPRVAPRKFGKVLPGEIERCKAIAQAHGIVLDPIWTLAAWEAAEAVAAAGLGEGEVLMWHTGGALGLCGVAQRYPDEF